MLLYYITDRSQLPDDGAGRRAAVLSKIAEAARAGVDYIQLREKDLATRALELLAAEAVRLVREANSLPNRRGPTRLLINSRTDVAMAVGADGVHLRSDDISPEDSRSALEKSKIEPKSLLIASSCHSLEEVRRAEAAGADLAVFAPVFEKKGVARFRSSRLTALAEACRGRIPVLALGGVTLDNARDCANAGAAGVAGIRMFQENSMEQVVRSLNS